MGRRLVRWKAVVILLVVLGIIFYVVMAQSRQRLDALSTRNEQLQQQYAALDQKNRDLREEMTYVATDAYIEETARNEFGYVRDGEIHFHFASMDVLRGYTEAEWNEALKEYERFTTTYYEEYKDKLTEEDLVEIGRLQGRFMKASMTRGAKFIEKNFNDAIQQASGLLDGLFEENEDEE